MILLCGIPSERPLQMVGKRLLEASIPVVVLNQRETDRISIELDICTGEVTGLLGLGNRRYRLEDIEAVYTRLMSPTALPELEDEPEDSPRRHHAERWHDAFVRWCEIAPARVVNRIYPSSSNSSKVFQSHLIREAGFRIPETLLTDDPDEVRAFLADGRQVIFKSASGARSIVTRLGKNRFADLDRVAHCPTAFQERVNGTNVRVHVVGDELFATRVDTAALDYRYALAETGVPAELSPLTLPDDLAGRCVELARRLGLAFAGIDLMIAPDGSSYCFEVNPCPGFSYFELSTGQPISAALARYLAGQAGVKSSRHFTPASISAGCRSSGGCAGSTSEG